MNKKQRYYFGLFIRTIEPKSLYDVYKNPSGSKRAAWKRIESACKSIKGFHLTVLTHTAQRFTCAYAHYHDNEAIISVFTPVTSFDITVSNPSLIRFKL